MSMKIPIRGTYTIIYTTDSAKISKFRYEIIEN